MGGEVSLRVTGIKAVVAAKTLSLAPMPSLRLGLRCGTAAIAVKDVRKQFRDVPCVLAFGVQRVSRSRSRGNAQ